MTGDTNDQATGASYQEFLDKAEAYSFNTLGYLSKEKTIRGLFVVFTKRLRDEMGIKFQTLLFNMATDYEGVINLKNRVKDADEASLVYLITGALAGCEVKKAVANKEHDDEFLVDTAYKQSQYMAALNAGEFVFHKVGAEVRVLDEINSFVFVSQIKMEILKVVRSLE